MTYKLLSYMIMVPEQVRDSHFFHTSLCFFSLVQPFHVVSFSCLYNSLYLEVFLSPQGKAFKLVLALLMVSMEISQFSQELIVMGSVLMKLMIMFLY